MVFPGVPHHVTQRGNDRQQVFFRDGDQAAYLTLLREHALANSVEVVAYCLMPNHVHLVVVPASSAGLHKALKAVHGQYAQRVNRMKDRTGHLWQGRYFSSPLDQRYFLNAVRYVELNPVRARMVARAEQYLWSSAASHCGGQAESLVTPSARWSALAGITDWSLWLQAGLPEESLTALRRHGSQNMPCGADEFIAGLERVAGRSLRYANHGGARPAAKKSLAPSARGRLFETGGTSTAR
jgi:putative transposase